MSSIGEHDLKSLKAYFQSVTHRGQSLLQELIFGSESRMGEINWDQLRNEVELITQALELTECLVDKLESECESNNNLEKTIKMLEDANVELCESNKKYLSLIEDLEEQKQITDKMVHQLELQSTCSGKQSQNESNDIVQKELDQVAAIHDFKIRLLQAEIAANQRKIKELGNNLANVKEQLLLKTTQCQLVQLVLQEVRAKNDRLEVLSLKSNFSPQRSRKMSNQFQCMSEFNHSSSSKFRRQSSLHQDLVESHIMFEPHISSHVFKSTDTIPQLEQGRQRCKQLNSMDEVDQDYSNNTTSQKRSKAIGVDISTSEFQSEETSCQTETPTLLRSCSQFYHNLKSRLITRRLRK